MGCWVGGVVVVFTLTGVYSSTSNNEALKNLQLFKVMAKNSDYLLKGKSKNLVVHLKTLDTKLTTYKNTNQE